MRLKSGLDGSYEVIEADAKFSERRQRMVGMIKPGMKYAVLVDNPDADQVTVSVGIRGLGTCEIDIAKDKYDPIAMIEVIEELL